MRFRDIFRRKAPPPTPPGGSSVGLPEDSVTQHLERLLRNHNFSIQTRDHCLYFADVPYTAEARVVLHQVHDAGHSVQLDLRFGLEEGRYLIESCGGMGRDRDAAVGNAFESFTLGSLHVLMAGFFRPPDEYVTVESWPLGRSTRTVVIGNASFRGQPPDSVRNPTSWFELLQRLIQLESLDPSSHWVRFYYGHLNRRMIACEVLLDNETWEPVETAMTEYPWPESEVFYGVRLFMIVKGTGAQTTRRTGFASLAGEP